MFIHNVVDLNNHILEENEIKINARNQDSEKQTIIIAVHNSNVWFQTSENTGFSIDKDMFEMIAKKFLKKEIVYNMNFSNFSDKDTEILANRLLLVLKEVVNDSQIVKKEDKEKYKEEYSDRFPKLPTRHLGILDDIIKLNSCLDESKEERLDGYPKFNTSIDDEKEHDRIVKLIEGANLTDIFEYSKKPNGSKIIKYIG